LALQSIPFLAPLRRPLRPFKRFFNLLRHSQKQYDYSDRQLRTAVEESLTRLQTDYIDLYQLYNPTRAVLEAGEFVNTLESLKGQGKIRYYGVSCRTADDALLCLKYSGISSVQLPVSMIDQDAIPSVIPRLAERRVAVIAREPLGQGLLTGAGGRTLAEESARSRREINDRKRRSAAFSRFATPGRTLAQAALQFVLRLPGISTVIPGIANLQQLEENLGALTVPQISEDEFARALSLSASGPR
jgi:aryl-alcohol dehydrogenase-like predicted oxidoreductase